MASLRPRTMKASPHTNILLESVDEFMGADKIEVVNIAFLPEDASIKVIYIKLLEVSARESMHFQ